MVYCNVQYTCAQGITTPALNIACLPSRDVAY
jgi:hypothetical protein